MLFVLIILTVAALIKLNHVEARNASIEALGGRYGTQ